MIEKLELSEKTIPTAAPYNFISEFNRVQTTILINGLPTQDCNLVLGTATSTGKTISAEFFIHSILGIGKRIIYVAPMKALVREKYEEWQEHFKDKSVAILTGDYRPTAASRELLKNAHIIVVTSEMLDSQTRSALRSTHDHWIHDIGGLIMDEAHIIGSNDRGPAAEAGITRLCSIDIKNPPRIILLSATLPNVDDFTHWLYKLNGKKTYALNSKWRPVPLKWNFYPCSAKYYSAQRSFMISQCVAMVSKNKEDKFLIFTHEKKTGHDLNKALEKVGIPSEFHRADLSKDKRIAIENSFKSRDKGALRILLSTSGLSWGINMPAKNVIIVGTNRGITPLDMADIIQMSGRAGRAGFDEIGYCHLLCNDTDTSSWSKKVQMSAPVESSLLNAMHLRFQVMAEIDLGLIERVEDIYTWFERTLAGQQIENPKENFTQAISKLVKWDMITANSMDELDITPLGKVGTSRYFTPDDVYYWYTFMKDNPIMDSDSKLAALIGGSPTMCLSYTPKEFENTVPKFLKACREDGTKHNLQHPFTSYALWEHLQGNANDIASLKFQIQSIIQDIERIEGALQEISSLTGTVLPTDLVIRMMHGVPKQLTFLCNIPGIGPKKAWLLYMAGITDPKKLEETDRSVLVTCLGGATSTKVWNHIHQI